MTALSVVQEKGERKNNTLEIPNSAENIKKDKNIAKLQTEKNLQNSFNLIYIVLTNIIPNNKNNQRKDSAMLNE